MATISSGTTDHVEGEVFVSTSVVLSIIKSEMIWSLMVSKQFVWKFLSQIPGTLLLHQFIDRRTLHLSFS